MNSQPSRCAVRSVRAVKAAVTAGLAGTAIVLTLGGALANSADEPPETSDTSAPKAERVSPDARCAIAPGRTIVRTPAGDTKVVSFKQGWKVYRGERPGTLVVVCPD